MSRRKDEILRYTASERVNHWTVAICFVLLALSGLAFFHPAFFFLTGLFGGGPWTRILHPYIGLVLFAGFALMVVRFWRLNLIEPRDKEWLKRVPALASSSDDRGMPEQGKYNGGQKLLFWGLVIGIALLLLTGLVMWRAWWTPPILLIRLASVLHAIAAVWCIGLILLHIYAAIWVPYSIHAMARGMVSRAWARQHHRAWYRKMTGDNR
jgi:formate dehydrogenase subunit gamma